MKLIQFILFLESRYPFLFRHTSLKLIASNLQSKNKLQRPSRSKKLIIQSIYKKDSQRLMIFNLLNPALLVNESLFKKIFTTLMRETEFKNFGNEKVIIIQAIVNGRTYSITHNIKINNKMKFNEYWDLIKNDIISNFDKDYLIDSYYNFKILVWNMDQVKNKTIIYSNNKIGTGSVFERFNLIKNKFIKNKRLYSTDITPLNKNNKFSPFLIYNKELLNDLSNIQIKIIFVHDQDNLLFDFIYNNLLTKFEPSLINLLKDKNNQFIYIKLFGLTFLNSYKIFPIKENELINLFKGKDLYESLLKAQIYYYKNYNVDITSVVSIGSLAFKIFRTNFLNVNIPLLTLDQDSFIRKSYFGGAVHVFKNYARKVYYYDVNSLYPFAMLKPMPFKMIKFHNDMKKINLNNFFGFIKVEVTINKSVKKVLLPRRLDDKIIYQTGKFIGTYFSEELKLFTKNPNYKFKLIEGYEFSKFTLFKKYVDTFYNLKLNSNGTSRFIAKQLLNNLYGFFGRTYDLISTVFVNNNNLSDILNSDIKILQISVENDYSKINYINNNESYQIKNNVAIASAITSYARIIMHPFLLLSSVLYSDTDSLFTDKPLIYKFIGKEIGLFKDEMNGIIIQEAIFLGPKRYGYYYFKNNQKFEKSVYAGLERDSLSFRKIKQIYNKSP